MRPTLPLVCLMIFLMAGPLLGQRPLPATGDAINLRVTDDRGGPIQNARITLRGVMPVKKRYRNLPTQRPRQLTAKSFQGDFARIEGLPEGEFVWFVEADGFALTVSKKFELPSRKPARITVKMQRGTTITGSVTTPDGKPLANAQVTTTCGHHINQSPFAKLAESMTVYAISRSTTRTAQDGTYRLPAMARGKYRIRVNHEAFADGHRDFTVNSGSSYKAKPVVMPTGTIIKGYVARNSKRVPNAIVVLHSIAKPVKGTFPHMDLRIEITADDNGQFRMPRVAAGDYQLSAHEPGQPLAMAMQTSGSRRTITVKTNADDDVQIEVVVLPQ